MDHLYLIEPGKIFTIFFIMLGPLRFMDTYANVTASVSPEERKKLALKTGLIAILALLISGLLGAKLIEQWSIIPAALMLAVGLIFFVVAASPVIYGETKNLGKLKSQAPDELALNLLITPYGMAALIVLISVANDTKRLMVILGCLLLVMVINILFMAFKKPSDESKKSLFIKIISGVLATMQFALAIQIILGSLNNLGIIDIQR